MAVKIKLTRLGSKKHPFYRIVATNLENARDSRPLEFLGHYNPMLSPAEVVLEPRKSRSGSTAAPSRLIPCAPSSRIICPRPRPNFFSCRNWLST